jgi:hypothetical protein
VTSQELGFGSDVEHHDLATPQAGSELVAVDELDAVTLAEVGAGKPVETSDSLSGDSPHRGPQLGDMVGAEPVGDAGAVAAGRDQAAAHQGSTRSR